MSDTSGIYSIGAVAAMIEVPVATLRTWEERYGVVVPARSQGGHRLYSHDHVEQLRFVADQVADGLSVADAHRLLAERIATRTDPPLLQPEPRPRWSILLAERDPYAAELADHFLRAAGYDVTRTFDADELLAPSTGTGRRPDLVLIDLLIAGGRGLELCRALSRDRGMRVVALSSVEQGEAALAAGAAAFLLKPVDPQDLVSTVRDRLDHVMSSSS